MPPKRWRPEDLTHVRGRRPYTATIAMNREELDAFELLAAIHGYQGIAPFLRRLLLDCADAHGIGLELTEYPLPGCLEVTRETALRRAVERGSYTPPPRWWWDLEREAIDARRRARARLYEENRKRREREGGTLARGALLSARSPVRVGPSTPRAMDPTGTGPERTDATPARPAAPEDGAR